MWLYMGVILYIAFIISMSFMPVAKGNLRFIHGAIGVIALLIGIPFVEKELKEKFDDDNQRIN